MLKGGNRGASLARRFGSTRREKSKRRETRTKQKGSKQEVDPIYVKIYKNGREY